MTSARPAPPAPEPSLEDLVYRPCLLAPDTPLRRGDRARVLALSLLAYGAIGTVVATLGARTVIVAAAPRTVTLRFLEEIPPLAPPPPPGPVQAQAPRATGPATPAAEPVPLVPAPIQAPSDALPPPAASSGGPGGTAGIQGGVAGGQAGGVVGGTLGGVVPPRFDAAYLQNPAPDYPSLSRRLGEEGRTLLRVLIAPDGLPREVQLQASSGFPRLDQAALQTVRRWRFVPAMRGDEALPAWVLVPIRFNLES